jgi:hypothetical protein
MMAAITAAIMVVDLCLLYVVGSLVVGPLASIVLVVGTLLVFYLAIPAVLARGLRSGSGSHQAPHIRLGAVRAAIWHHASNSMGARVPIKSLHIVALASRAGAGNGLSRRDADPVQIQHVQQIKDKFAFLALKRRCGIVSAAFMGVIDAAQARQPSARYKVPHLVPEVVT